MATPLNRGRKYKNSKTVVDGLVVLVELDAPDVVRRARLHKRVALSRQQLTQVIACKLLVHSLVLARD